MAKGKTGDTAKKEYNIWAMMRQRCYNSNAQNYNTYGAKGVTVCEEWKSFKSFFADMGECPENHTLDRIDTFGNYEPSNCKWSNVEEQQNNKRNTVRITAFGETKGIAQWSRSTSLSRDMIYHRIYVMGMSPEEAMQTAKMSHNQCQVNQFTLDGELIATYESLADVGKKLNIDKRKIHPALTGKSKTAMGYIWKYVNEIKEIL